MNKFRYIIVSKKTVVVSLLVAVLLIASVFTATGWDKTLSVSNTDKKLPIYRTYQPTKKVALSFDAAWGNEDTGELIKILGKYNIKATFFVVGGWVDKYPESVKQLADAGHEVMNHSNTHPHMSELSIEQISEEINSCNDKIEAITGRRPILHRAPFGEYTNNLIDVLTSLNMYCIQWDVDVLDKSVIFSV